MEKENDELQEKEVELTGILEEFRNALKSEIEIIKKNGQSSILLKNGHRINYDKSNYWYEFKIDYLPNMPEDTPCNLIIGNDTYKVTVVSFDESRIIVSSDVELPPAISLAKLDNGATVLMERMINRIEVNSTKDNPTGKRMLNDYFDKSFKNFSKISNKKIDNIQRKLAKNQEKAVNSAIQNDITYIWGPPGTGKTIVIGEIINQLYNMNRKVLIVSHTNVAVDGAINKVEDLAKKEKGSVLRLGTPQKKISEEVTLDYHIKLRGEELFNRKENLKATESKKIKELEEKNNLLNKFEWLGNNNVEYLIALSEKFQKLEKRYNEIQEDYDTIENQYNDFLNDNFDILKLKNDIDTTEQEIDFKKGKIKELHSIIKECDNEISIHNRYNTLKEQLDEYISEHTLKNKIQELKNELELFEQKQKEVIEKIDDYNTLINIKQKGGLKALLNRGNIKFAEEQKPIEEDNLNKIKKVIEIDKKTLKRCEKQIIDITNLNGQIEDIKTTNTKEFWVDRKNESEMQILTEEKEIKELKNERKILLKSIADAKVETVELPALFERLKKIEKKSIEKKNELEKVSADYEEEERIIAEQLLIEKNKIHIFSFANTIENIEKYDSIFDQIIEIKQLLKKIEKELEHINEKECIKEKNNIEKELNEIQKELEEIEEKISEIETEAIKMAKVVGTTLTKSYIHEILQGCEFDTVIIDEASMAPIPALWCASFFAKRNIVIVGDFLQLAPIAILNSSSKKEDENNEIVKKWLGTDIFNINKIPEKIKKGQDDNIVILDEQFRMEKQIADVANMYYGEYCTIKTAEKDEDRLKDYKNFYEWYGKKEKDKTDVEIIDTSNLHAWVTTIPQGKSSSRMNVFSATLCVEMAIKMINQYKKKHINDVDKKPKVLIIAPYKPHVDQIRKIIEHLSNEKDDYASYIRSGTIHSFQGDEADIVIFDLVVDEPHWRANIFLKDDNNDGIINKNLRQLFNVAITRAKYKLFIVGNIPYLRERANHNELEKLLSNLIDKNKFNVTDGKSAFPKLSFVKSSSEINAVEANHVICKEDVFFDYLENDIKISQKRIIIYSPFMTNNRVGDLLPLFSNAISNNKEIIVITKSLSERNKKELYTYQTIEEELRKIGIKVIYKKGMHEKLVFIDDTIIWNGSLNALSNSGSTSEIMHRIFNKEIVQEYEKLYNIPQLINTTEKEEMNCPICDERMELNEGTSGLYWKCINGDFTRSINEEFPSDGVWRCKRCGGEYEFFMKNEPRWRCSANNEHFAKVKLFDLTLPKMVEKIPKSDYKKVEEYFNGKIKLKDVIEKNRFKKAKKEFKNIENIGNVNYLEDNSFFSQKNDNINKEFVNRKSIQTEDFLVRLEKLDVEERIKDIFKSIFNEKSITDLCDFDYKTLMYYNISCRDIETIDNILNENEYVYLNTFINEYSFKSIKESTWFYNILEENGVTENNISNFNLLLLFKDEKIKIGLKAYVEKYFIIG